MLESVGECLFQLWERRISSSCPISSPFSYICPVMWRVVVKDVWAQRHLCVFFVWDYLGLNPHSYRDTVFSKPQVVSSVKWDCNNQVVVWCDWVNPGTEPGILLWYQASPSPMLAFFLLLVYSCSISISSSSSSSSKSVSSWWGNRITKLISR